jgi:hypothetical protein
MVTRFSTPVVLVFVAIAGVSACANRTNNNPEAVVATFYRVTGGRILGEPSELQRIEPLLSRHLNGLILDAVAYRASWIRHHPDEPARNGRPPVILKPPWAEGFSFVNSNEGFHNFSIWKTVPNADDTWSVYVNFSYDCAPNCSLRWRDIVIVKREAEDYVIDDVVFSPRDAAEIPVHLSAVLRE